MTDNINLNKIDKKMYSSTNKIQINKENCQWEQLRLLVRVVVE